MDEPPPTLLGQESTADQSAKPEAEEDLSGLDQSKHELGRNDSKAGADGSNVALQDSRSGSSLGLAPRIQDFQILKPISRGAFGKVFLCHKRDHPSKKLAVKVSQWRLIIKIFKILIPIMQAFDNTVYILTFMWVSVDGNIRTTCKGSELEE